MEIVARALFLVCVAVIAGCGGPASAPADGGSTDTGHPADAAHDASARDAGRDAGSDGGAHDAAVIEAGDLDASIDAAPGPDAFVCADGDGDGATALSCGGTDCDDGDPAIAPGAPEVCDGADDDCDGSIDETVLRTYFRDADHDGFGDASVTMTGCIAPAGYVDDGTDCDDTNASAHASTAPEICDGADNDCDAIVDESAAPTAWYVDADGDGYGDVNDTSPMLSCVTILGYVTNADDCDDTSLDVHPGATEICDGLDEDCSSGGGADPIEDQDGDHFTQPGTACVGGFPQTDCSDDNPLVNPAATFHDTPVQCVVYAGPLGRPTLSIWCPDAHCCLRQGVSCAAGATCVSGTPNWDYDCNGTNDVEPALVCTADATGGCTSADVGVMPRPSDACGSEQTELACTTTTSGSGRLSCAPAPTGAAVSLACD
jgi:hypothetical protein